MKEKLVNHSNQEYSCYDTNTAVSFETKGSSDKKKVALPKKVKKGMPNYMIYQGKIKHYCKGRCVIGSKPLWGLLSLVLYNLPAILLYSTITPYYQDRGTMWVITSIIVALQLLTNISFLFTVCANPGILPRLQLAARTLQNIEATRDKGAFSLILGNGGRYIARIKYCHTCLIYRPERAFHCHFCGNCIHRFDHHCKWLGTCIGGRNYKQFFLFLVFLALLQWCCIGYSISHFVLLMKAFDNSTPFSESFYETLKQAPTTMVVIAFCLIVAGFVTHLFWYHIKIISKSQSTYENKKGHFKNSLFNPYKQSFYEELSEILCRKRPRKYYNLRENEAEKLSESLRSMSYKIVKKNKVIQKNEVHYRTLVRLSIRSGDLNEGGDQPYRRGINETQGSTQLHDASLIFSDSDRSFLKSRQESDPNMKLGMEDSPVIQLTNIDEVSQEDLRTSSPKFSILNQGEQNSNSSSNQQYQLQNDYQKIDFEKDSPLKEKESPNNED